MARNKTAACMIGKLGADAKDFTDDELDEIIERLEGRAKARKAQGALGDEMRARFADADRAAYELRLAAAVTKRNAALQVAVLNAARMHIASFSNAKSSAGTQPKNRLADIAKAPIKRAPGGMSDVQGLQALLASSNKKVDGARDSYDAIYRARYNEFVEAMFAELEKEGALPALQGRRVLGVGIGPGFLDEKIMGELWELTSPNGKPGVTESPEALKAARIVHKYMDLARITQNRHGAFIEELRGYIAYQMHDRQKLQAEGFVKWREDVLNFGLDVPRTFGKALDLDELEAALQGIYDTLVSGKISEEMPVGPEIDKTKNVAKQVSHRRVVHFQNAKGWGDYNAKYGHGSVMDAVLWTLERSAKTAAMLEKLGPNPRATWNTLRDELIQLNKSDPKVVEALRSRSLDTLMDAADGAVDQVDNPMFAAVGRGVRFVETTSSLGGMVLSAVTDIPTQAARLSYNGKNFFQALGEQITGFIGNDRETAGHLAFGASAMINDIESRYHGNDGAAGWMGTATSIFFKANLGQWWDQRRYRAFIATLGSELYAARNTEWGALKPDVRSTLATYGFDAPEWNIVRKYGAKQNHGGEGGVIHGEPLRYVPDDELRPLLGSRRATAGALDRMRDKLERMVRTYYADQLAWATLQPGVREKALTTMGAKRGTVGGEAARSFFLFKGYPIQYWQRVIGQFTQEDQHLAIARGLGALPKSEYVRLAQLIAANTALGFVAFALKDIAKGRTPRDPTDPKVIGAAFLQGGGLGIYGDFLLGTKNRYGQSFLGSIGGPVAGDVEALAKMAMQLRDAPWGDDPEGDMKSLGDQVFKFGKENTPFLNIFYTRAAVDYLVLYRMQEWLNPGSLRRMERRIKEENNQEFIIPPSEVVN